MLISIFLHKVELWLKLIVPIQTFFLLHIFSHRIDLQMVVIYFNTQWPRNIAQQCATEDPTGNYVQMDRFRTLSLIEVGGWVNSSFGEQCHSLFTSRTMLAKAMVFRNWLLGVGGVGVGPYLIFVTHATHGVSVKKWKWEEFFPYWTRKGSLCNLIDGVLCHTQCVIFTHSV